GGRPGSASTGARFVVLHADTVRPRRLLLRRVGLVVVMIVLAAAEALDVGDQIDELGEGEAVTVVRHDRAAIGPNEAGAGEDHGVGIDDRLREVFRRVVRAHAGQLGADVARAARLRKVGLHLVALVALELGEELAAGLRIARWQRELPAARHPAAAVQLFHADRRRRLRGRRRGFVTGALG